LPPITCPRTERNGRSRRATPLIFLPSKAMGVNGQQSGAEPGRQSSDLVVSRPDGSGQIAGHLRLLERPMRRLTIEHQGVGQQVDQVGEGNLLLVRSPAVSIEQIGQKGRVGHEIEQVQCGIGQRQPTTDLGSKGHPCHSAMRKMEAQLQNSLWAMNLPDVKDLQSSTP
jgi:hypothetical protein